MQDIEHIFRKAQQHIDRHFEDDPRPVILRRGMTLDEKLERLTNLAYYHADVLGRLLSEISACHEGKLVQGKTVISHRSGDEHSRPGPPR
jgi:hypothetical protein